MKRFFVILLASIVVCLACSKKEERIENVKLSPQQMSELYMDLAKAERLASNQTSSTKERNVLLTSYRKSIFQHYNISQQEYEEQIQIYLNNPQLMEKLAKLLPDNSAIPFEL